MSDYPDGLIIEPLGDWPGARRAAVPSPFSASLSDTLELLRRELRALDARGSTLQVAIAPADFRQDGRPRARAVAAHPGVILTVETRAGALSFPCDSYTTWQANLRAITLVLEALRKIDRYGVGQAGQQRRGYLAIEAATEAGPAPIRVPSEAWNFLATVAAGEPRTIPAPSTRAEAGSLLRRAQRVAHPDQPGGDMVTMQRVHQAEQVLRDAGLL